MRKTVAYILTPNIILIHVSFCQIYSREELLQFRTFNMRLITKRPIVQLKSLSNKKVYSLITHFTCISGAFKRLDFPDPPSINNYVRYDVEDFGDITEFSVSIWIREYEIQTYNGYNDRGVFSYSSEGRYHGNSIFITRDIEDNSINVCLAGECLHHKGSRITCKSSYITLL